jgi:WD40 repeat protein
MGVLYKARQVALNRVVALKMLLEGRRAGPEQQARFRTEYEALARLQHPNIVQIYEVGEVEGCPYFAQELVTGGTLAAALAGRPLPAQAAAKLVLVLARAIQHAHEHGVLHRDLKPANVLLAGPAKPQAAEEGKHPSSAACGLAVPKIADFGLARHLEGPGLSATGSILGTPSYMAPEQASGVTHRLGPAVDVYALGATLYECLTGRPPFLGASPVDTVLLVLSADAVPPRSLQPGVPGDLETICLKCLHKEPARRYASAAELADDLARYLDGRPILARPVGPLERGLKWARRRPALAAFWGMTFLAALTVFAVVLGYNFRLERLYGEAERARQNEQAERERAEDRLVCSHLASTTRLLQQGDLFAALPVAVEALALAAGHPEREKMHRLRVGAIRARCPRLAFMGFHDGEVLYADLSPDGRTALSAGADGTARLWDVRTGQERVLPLRHAGPVVKAIFSPDGARALTAGGDGVAKLWDARTGALVRALPGHTGGVTSVAISPDGARMASAGADGVVRLWGAEGSPTVAAAKHKGPVHHVAFSPDGRLLLTAGEDGIVWVVRASDGSAVAGPLAHPYPVQHASFDPEGKRIAVACGQRRYDGLGEMVVWKVAGGERITKPGVARRECAVSAVFSGDGHRVLLGGVRGQVVVRDAVSGEIVLVILSAAPEGAVTVASFSPDERRALAASLDGTVRLWNVPADTLAAPPLRHAGPVRHAAFSRDGRYVLSASADGSVRLWDLAPLAPDQVFPHTGPVLHATFSPDGRLVATASAYAEAQVWEAATALPAGPPLPHYFGSVLDVRFSPDGRRALTAGLDREARVWAVEGGSLLRRLRHPGGVLRAIFSPDGSLIATASNDTKARLWGPAGEVGAPLAHGKGVVDVAFSPDGRLLLTRDAGGEARVLRVEKGGGRLAWKRQGVEQAVFSPAGGLVLTAGPGPLACLYDLEGKPARPPWRQWTAVRLVAFSGDGRLALTAGTGPVAHVWAVGGGADETPLLHANPLDPGLAPPAFASFSANGALVLTGALDKVSRAWDTGRGELLAPPWRHPLSVRGVELRPDGRQALMALGEPAGLGAAVLWSLPSEPLPLDDLRLLGQVLSGQRVLPDGRAVPLTPEALRPAWEALQSSGALKGDDKVGRAVAWHRWEAFLCSRAGRLPAARDHLDRLIALVPGRWDHYLGRANVRVLLGQFGPAAADLARAIALGGTNDVLWRTEGQLRLALGQRKAYRRVCADALKHFGGTDVPHRAYLIADLCVQAPGAVDDYGPVMALAERALAAYPGDGMALLLVGAAHYRRGDAAQAVRRLEEAVQAQAPTPEPAALFYLALAQAGLGQAKEARAALEAGKKRLAPLPGLGRAPLERLRAEAEAAVGRAEGGK